MSASSTYANQPVNSQNPFPIGVPVSGEELADRETELQTIVKEVESGGRLFLISPRRYGKTSLLLEARRRLQPRIPVAYLDLFQATSLAHFLDLFAKGVIESVEGAVEKAIRVAGEYLRAIRPTMTVNPQGEPEWSIGLSQQQADLLDLRDQVLALPGNLAKRKKLRLAVFMDEFQEVRNFDGLALEKAMRASFQQQPQVSYVFAGSKESLMWDMVRSRKSPFFRSGPTLSLGPLPAAEFTRFLSTKFKKAGMSISREKLGEILRLADEIPYNVQYLCHALWNVKQDRGEISGGDMARAMEYVLSAETAYYVSLWDQFSLHQRRTVRALARSGAVAPFNKTFLAEYDLGPSASVARSLAQLLKYQILRKSEKGYRFADPFFRLWVQTKIA